MNGAGALATDAFTGDVLPATQQKALNDRHSTKPANV